MRLADAEAGMASVEAIEPPQPLDRRWSRWFAFKTLVSHPSGPTGCSEVRRCRNSPNGLTERPPSCPALTIAQSQRLERAVGTWS